MTETQSFKELLEWFVVLMVSVVDVLLEVGVVKVHVGHSGSVLFRLWVVHTILVRAGRESLELHDVLGQCTSLVAEDVVHHAKLLVQV